MNKKEIIIGLLGALAILAIGISITLWGLSNDEKDIAEKKWYASKLNYSFCASIQTIEVLNHKWGYGFIWCKVRASSDLNSSQEDSLQSQLKEWNTLRLIVRHEGDSVKLLVPGILQHQVGDSICVETSINFMTLYRGKTIAGKSKIYECLFDERFK